jgi:hypothetical protein
MSHKSGRFPLRWRFRHFHSSLFYPCISSMSFASISSRSHSSDVHTVTGGWGGLSVDWCCPGHEIIGTAVHVGENVKEFKQGQRVCVHLTHPKTNKPVLMSIRLVSERKFYLA